MLFAHHELGGIAFSNFIQLASIVSVTIACLVTAIRARFTLRK